MRSCTLLECRGDVGVCVICVPSWHVAMTPRPEGSPQLLHPTLFSRRVDAHSPSRVFVCVCVIRWQLMVLSFSPRQARSGWVALVACSFASLAPSDRCTGTTIHCLFFRFLGQVGVWCGLLSRGAAALTLPIHSDTAPDRRCHPWIDRRHSFWSHTLGAATTVTRLDPWAGKRHSRSNKWPASTIKVAAATTGSLVDTLLRA